jgi:hypothetical protein
VLRNAFERFEHLRVRRADPVIRFQEFPAHNSLFIYYIGGRVRQSPTVRIKNAVTIDYGMSGIGKQQDPGMGSIAGNFPGDFPQILFAVYRNGENDRVFQGRFFNESIQLAKLINAERSPVAAIEYQHYILFVPVT